MSDDKLSRSLDAVSKAAQAVVSEMDNLYPPGSVVLCFLAANQRTPTPGIVMRNEVDIFNFSKQSAHALVRVTLNTRHRTVRSIPIKNVVKP